MKIAYICSRYPAVSHTFIQREIDALRARGIDVGTFSVRRPTPADILGSESQREAAATRSLVPFSGVTLLRSVCWVWGTRPRRALQALKDAVGRRKQNMTERLLGFGYYLEAIILARWLVTEGFDHLHCHFGNSGANPAMMAAELSDISFSMTCHGSELLEPKQHRLAEKVARCAFVACVSKHGKAQLMLHCPPHHWSKLQVVHCGLSFPEIGYGSSTA
jgi:colanic acid/amylovoran biosynthesis glycosyltransferase